MAYSNGMIPDARLVSITGTPGARLLSGAASAWESLRSAVHRAHGWYPTVTGPTDAFRSHAVQESIFRARYTPTYLRGRPFKVWNGQRWYQKPDTAQAAVPGTSNHGRGVAVDITGLGGFTGTRYKQLAAIAAGLGWSNTEGRSIGEAWHWVYTGPAEIVTNPGPTTPAGPGSPSVAPPTPIEEDPLAAFTEEQVRRMIRDEVRTVLGLGGANMSMPDVVKSIKGIPDGVWAKHVNANSQGLGEATAAQYLADVAVHARKASANTKG